MDPVQQSTRTHRKKLSGRTKAGLWLLLGPTVLIASTFVLFALTNLALGNVPSSVPAECTPPASEGLFNEEPCNESLFGEQSGLETIINVILFVAGAVGVLTWLPGLIIGIVLLATRVKTPPSPHQD